jgi:hypothetical protein
VLSGPVSLSSAKIYASHSAHRECMYAASSHSVLSSLVRSSMTENYHGTIQARRTLCCPGQSFSRHPNHHFGSFTSRLHVCGLVARSGVQPSPYRTLCCPGLIFSLTIHPVGQISPMSLQEQCVRRALTKTAKMERDACLEV